MQSWHKPKLSIFFWIAAAAWCGMLFYLSGQDATASSNLSLRVTRFVLRALPFLPYSEAEFNLILRDIAHFCVFALEGFFLGSATMTLFPKRLAGGLLAILSCAVVAVFNEYHQTFIKGRACEVSDMLVDTGGAVLGVLFAALVLWLGFRIALRRNKC